MLITRFAPLLSLALSCAAACQSGSPGPNAQRQIAIPPPLAATVPQPAAKHVKAVNTSLPLQGQLPGALVPPPVGGSFSSVLVPKSAADADGGGKPRASFTRRGSDYVAHVKDPAGDFTWVVASRPTSRLTLVSIEDGKAVIEPMHNALISTEKGALKVSGMRLTRDGLEVNYAPHTRLLLQPIGRSLRIDLEDTVPTARGVVDIDMGGVLGMQGVQSIGTMHVPYFDIAGVASLNLGKSGMRYLTGWLDTEISNSSNLRAILPGLVGNDGQVAFGQIASYANSTKRRRHPLRERLWINWSPNIEDVLPSMNRPPAKGIQATFDRFFISLNTTPFPKAKQQIESLAGMGIERAQIWVHKWQRDGYDVGYPNQVMPPNQGWGGPERFATMREAAKTAGFGFAMHHNWLFNGVRIPGLDLLESSGKTAGEQVGGTLMKSAAAVSMVDQVEGEFHTSFDTVGTFTDSLTAGLPYTDMDGTADGWGLLRTPLHDFAKVIERLRAIHGAPIAGEGSFGFGNVTWSGLVDVINGIQYLAAKPSAKARSGMFTEIVPHFALGNLHRMSVRSGMGAPARFWVPNNNNSFTHFSSQDRDALQTLTALYGNAGYHWIYELTNIGECARDWWSGAALFAKLAAPSRATPSIRYVDSQGKHADLSEHLASGGSLALGDVRLHLTWHSGDELHCNLTNKPWQPEGHKQSIAPWGYAADVAGVQAIIVATPSGVIQTLRDEDLRYLDGRGTRASAFGITTDGAVGARRAGKQAWQVYPIPEYTLAMPVIGDFELVETSFIDLDEELIGPGSHLVEWLDRSDQVLEAEPFAPGPIGLFMLDFTLREATSVRVTSTP